MLEPERFQTICPRRKIFRNILYSLRGCNMLCGIIIDSIYKFNLGMHAESQRVISSMAPLIVETIKEFDELRKAIAQGICPSKKTVRRISKLNFELS